MTVFIMRPNQCRTILHVLILAALLLTLNANNTNPEDEECITEIKVRRNTVYEALAGQELRINCTVVFCNTPTTVSWFKYEETSVPVDVSSSSHIKTERLMLKELEGISFLIFQNILRSDSGVYQCGSGGQVSHKINVSVNVNNETTSVAPKDNTTDTPNSNGDLPENLLIYVYSAAGIVTFVIIVIIISVISMRGCKGKSQKKTEPQTENQYMGIPMAEQPFPHASVQASPRESPALPPSRRSTKRRTPNESTLARDNEQDSGQKSAETERQRNTAEENTSSVVYAALNHQLPMRANARPRRLVEESSEYAAIRVA